MTEKQKLSQGEINFYEPLIKDYLSHSSVDNVFQIYRQNPGVSVAHFHRILKEWGIIKSAGPNTKLSHSLYFLCHMAREKLPLETAYHLSPWWLRRSVSMGTLHRMYQLAKQGLTRRHGTALLVSRESEPEKVLVGMDISSSSNYLGKPANSLSLPMTYSKKGEANSTAILRVLQQEVLAELAIKRQIPSELISSDASPLFSIAIADVKVNVFRLVLPDSLPVSSFKMLELEFTNLEDIAKEEGIDSPYRAGVPEIAGSFLELPTRVSHHRSLISHLNQALALIPASR